MPNVSFLHSVEMSFLLSHVATGWFWMVLAGAVQPLLASSFESEETLPGKRCCTSKAVWNRCGFASKSGRLETDFHAGY